MMLTVFVLLKNIFLFEIYRVAEKSGVFKNLEIYTILTRK